MGLAAPCASFFASETHVERLPVRHLQVEKEARDEGRLDAGTMTGVPSAAVTGSVKGSFRDLHLCEDGNVAVAQALERDVDLGGSGRS